MNPCWICAVVSRDGRGCLVPCLSSNFWPHLLNPLEMCQWPLLLGMWTWSLGPARVHSLPAMCLLGVAGTEPGDWAQVNLKSGLRATEQGKTGMLSGHALRNFDFLKRPSRKARVSRIQSLSFQEEQWDKADALFSKVGARLSLLPCTFFLACGLLTGWAFIVFHFKVKRTLETQTRLLSQGLIVLPASRRGNWGPKRLWYWQELGECDSNLALI